MAREGKNKTIIIHSKVSYGYVGLNTTSLVLQMGGQDVITVPTVLFSNHLGYPTVGGSAVEAPLFKDILDGLLKLDILDEVSSIITGYIGSADLVKLAADFIRKIKQQDPGISYLCDPVMGDTGSGLYVPEAVPGAIIEHLIPMADLLTPNQFEVQHILGRQFQSIDETVAAVNAHYALSGKNLVITGGHYSGTLAGILENCIIAGKQPVVLRARKIDVNPPGTGELFAAHLHLSMLHGKEMKEGVLRAGEILTAVLHKMYLENRTQFELKDISYSMDILKTAN
ncbi:pyridoxine kinase [Chitinophaga terrae (ex Kim and Jung 2007)]|uniref:pyridoxal kinase n=1 Tax=Chitinophaga terrae (ex Kim and Jung 2007) TaxID=408074 RepID=A0A1H4D687_9BACT|nr:pyridoxal kinase [Chitinophaga terrae (ex Kim and Jung 2007)]MDQ0110494.1 pyridoxine kinase [Chitinophaga terrae (ex Kim and Jung 2007)]GEP90517.1 pyridoxal kinase [Chitinophaga terrae (ex Kim and Jung 2007)]SEA68343.1 pyridoxine kinase [Chitinophaga terrae (ex Kim and Jung 2007)]